MGATHKENRVGLDLANIHGNGSYIADSWGAGRPDKDIPEGKAYKDDGTRLDRNADPIKGRQSLLHSLSVIHYSSFKEQGYANSPFYATDGDYYANSGPNATIDGGISGGQAVATGLKNPTGGKIVDAFNEQYTQHAMQYKENDFLFPMHYGAIPNNYMITLRRFSNPCGDNLRNNLENPSRDVSRLISWIDGEDNTMESMFSFTAGFNWKEFKSEIQTIERSKTGFGSQTLNDIAGLFDSTGRYAKEKLQGQAATDFDPYTEHQDNYTWGPIDVIDSIYTRDRGLKFEHNLEVKF